MEIMRCGSLCPPVLRCSEKPALNRVKNCTFRERNSLISSKTGAWCPVFFLLYRNVITTHISYWFFSEIPPQDRDGVAATVLPPGCLNRKLIEGKFWKVVPKFLLPFRKTLVHLNGFITPKSLRNTPKCVKWAKNVPLSTAQTNTGYPAFFCIVRPILTIYSTYVERKTVAPNPL